MNVSDAVRERYACRAYTQRAVSVKLLTEILDLARLAPSASNRQEWRFVAVTDKEKIDAITQKAGSQGWWSGAPVILACCAESDNHIMACGQPCYPIDVAICIDHITLLATERGLASCWLGAFKEPVVREILGIPETVRVVELLTLGYPSDKPRDKKRLGTEQILFLNGWDNK